MENKIYYLFDGNKVLEIFSEKLEAYAAYATVERSEYLFYEIIELTPEFGSVEKVNTITTITLNGKPYKCVVNSPKKSQELIDLYEEMDRLEDDYRRYSARIDRLYC